MTGDDRGPVHVQLVPLSAAVFAALADGDLAAAERISPVPLSPFFAGPDWTSVWRRRARQLADSPGDAGWVTQVIWDVDRQLAVRRAGFHGPPDDAGMVEIGYAVDPAFRRRGYARRPAHPAGAGPARTGRVTRLSIGPGNTASRQLAGWYGFVQVDVQLDDEDGLELVYQRSAKQA